MGPSLLQKLLTVNERGKEKKRYLRGLEPELRDLVKEAKLDVRKQLVRQELNSSQASLRELKKELELFEVLGLLVPDGEDSETSTDGCRQNSHKLLGCGHYTPSDMIPAPCDHNCSNGDLDIWTQERPYAKENEARSYLAVCKGFFEGNIDTGTVPSSAEERLEDFGEHKLACQTCVLRRFQTDFYFTMQKVSYDAELSLAVAVEPYEAIVPGLHRLVDFRFKNPDGTYVGGTVPIQLWDEWIMDRWEYINNVGIIVNTPPNPDDLKDLSLPPEHEEFDRQLLGRPEERNKLSRTQRSMPSFLPYSADQTIIQEYYIKESDSGCRKNKKQASFNITENGPSRNLWNPPQPLSPPPRSTQTSPHLQTSPPGLDVCRRSSLQSNMDSVTPYRPSQFANFQHYKSFENLVASSLKPDPLVPTLPIEQPHPQRRDTAHLVHVQNPPPKPESKADALDYEKPVPRPRPFLDLYRTPKPTGSSPPQQPAEAKKSRPRSPDLSCHDPCNPKPVPSAPTMSPTTAVHPNPHSQAYNTQKISSASSSSTTWINEYETPLAREMDELIIQQRLETAGTFVDAFLSGSPPTLFAWGGAADEEGEGPDFNRVERQDEVPVGDVWQEALEAGEGEGEGEGEGKEEGYMMHEALSPVAWEESRGVSPVDADEEDLWLAVATDI